MASARPEHVPSPAQGVGPFYRPEGEKPTATVSKEVSFENVHVLPQTPQLIALLTYASPYAYRPTVLMRRIV
jgi:uracil phosphoribosyltransferase